MLMWCCLVVCGVVWCGVVLPWCGDGDSRPSSGLLSYNHLQHHITIIRPYTIYHVYICYSETVISNIKHDTLYCLSPQLTCQQASPLDVEDRSEELLVQLSYAIKTQLKAPNAPYPTGAFLPFAVSLWTKGCLYVHNRTFPFFFA